MRLPRPRFTPQIMRVVRDVDRLDRSLFTAIAEHRSPMLDRVMPKLSRAADYSVLWMAVGAGLAATGDRRLKWAAERGLGNIALASLLTNQVGKRLAPRLRPAIESVPLARRVFRLPTSNSFPSGHSASAAAFAMGVSTQAPAAGIVVQALAGLVAFSRIATGAHYPSDVAVGWAIGSAVSTLGARVQPSAPPAKVTPAPPLTIDVPPHPRGAGVVCVINPRAGGGNGARVIRRIEKLLPEAEIVRLGQGQDLDDLLADAAARCDVLGVGGGDGTLQAGARHAIEHDVPLAVSPSPASSSATAATTRPATHRRRGCAWTTGSSTCGSWSEARGGPPSARCSPSSPAGSDGCRSTTSSTRRRLTSRSSALPSRLPATAR